MAPDRLAAYLEGWGRRAAFARTIGYTRTGIARWLRGVGDGPPTPIPVWVPYVICELERRRAYRHGLGTLSCPACDGICVEGDGLDDRYGCVACGERVDPDARILP